MKYLGYNMNLHNLNTEEQVIKNLNKEYEGKGLDQSGYLDFW